MALDLSNSNKLDEDFAHFTIEIGAPNHAQIRRKNHPVMNEIPSRLPSGDRLDDTYGDYSPSLPVPFPYSVTKYKVDEYSNISAKRKAKKEKRKVKRQGKKKDRREHIKQVLKGGGKHDGKVIHAIAKFSPVTLAMRGAMLTMLNGNVVGMSSALSDVKKSKTHWEQLQQKWWMLGGDKAHWDKAVERGKNKKPLFKDLLDKFHRNKGFDGSYSNSNGNGKANAGNAMIAASTALTAITAVLMAQPEPVLSKTAAGYVGLADAGIATMGGVLKSYAKDNGASPQDVNAIPEKSIPDVPVPTDEKTLDKVAKEIDNTDDDGNNIDEILGMPPTVFWIGLSAIVLIGGFLIYRKLIVKK